MAGRIGILACLLLFSSNVHAASPPGTGGCAPGAYLARWQAGAFGRTVAGHACWVIGPEGELRLEAGLAGTDRAAAADLFAQRGNGWSLILGEPGQGTYNRWAEAWREVPSGLESWVRAALLCGPRIEKGAVTGDRSPRPRFARDGTTTMVHRWIAPRLALDPSGKDQQPIATDRGFRRALVHRGRGRGAEQEIARLEIIPATPCVTGWARGSRMKLASSRRSGYLEWTILRHTDGIHIPAEAFLPLWPLSDFLDSTRVFAGTR